MSFSSDVKEELTEYMPKARHCQIAEIAAVIKDSLKEIAETTTWEDVPGTTIESCGNYKDHSLFSAKEWAKLILEQGISDDAFERHII